MVEIFFKGLKGWGGLAATSMRRTNENTVQCLIYARMTLGVLSLNFWRIMTALVNPYAAHHPGERGSDESDAMRTVAPLKLFELLPAFLLAAFRDGRAGRSFAVEIASNALRLISMFSVSSLAHRPVEGCGGFCKEEIRAIFSFSFTLFRLQVGIFLTNKLVNSCPQNAPSSFSNPIVSRMPIAAR